MCDEYMSAEEYDAIQADAALSECVGDPVVAKAMADNLVRYSAAMRAFMDPNTEIKCTAVRLPIYVQEQ